MSKRGLGKGLSALIPNARTGGVWTIRRKCCWSQIQPNPSQPRTDIDDEGISELADSIMKVGLLQPIIVRPHGEGYQIIAGERRWRAAKARRSRDQCPVADYGSRRHRARLSWR